jgi:hypothetical protein
MSNELLRRLKAHLKLKRMLDMQVTHEKSPMGKPSYRVPGDQSLAVPANSRKPINELDAVLGTRDDNPRFPLHSLVASLEAHYAGDGTTCLKVGPRRRPLRSTSTKRF